MEKRKFIFELDNFAERIERVVGKGGLIPFEHGYNKPIIQHKGHTYAVTMVEDKRVYCMGVDVKEREIFSIETLNKKSQFRIYLALLEYLFYCQTEA